MSIFKNSENSDLAKFNDTCTSCNLDFKSFEEIAIKKIEYILKKSGNFTLPIASMRSSAILLAI